MLPSELVAAASLEPGKENYALTFAAQLGSDETVRISGVDVFADARGQIADFKIAPSLLANVHKLSYGKVDAILDGAGTRAF